MIGSENIANSWKEIERAYIESLFRLTKTNMILLNSDQNETMCIAKPDERKDKSFIFGPSNQKYMWPIQISLLRIHSQPQKIWD